MDASNMDNPFDRLSRFSNICLKLMRMRKMMLDHHEYLLHVQIFTFVEYTFSTSNSNPRILGG